MLVSGTFIILSIKNQEIKKAEEELRQFAVYIDEQIIQQYEFPDEFQNGFYNLFLMNSSMKNMQGNILNSDGETIASSVSSDNINKIEYKNSVVISALAGNENFSSNKKNVDVNSQVKQWISYACPVFDKEKNVEYVIYVQMDAESITNSFVRTTKTILISVILALLLTGILGIIFANTITVPIALLTKKANQLAKGNLEQNIIVRSNDEIGQLTKSFNYMAKELRKTVSEMENENNKLEIVLHNMTDGVLAFDEKRNLIHANSVCCELMETEPDNITFEWILNELNIDEKEILHGTVREVAFANGEKYISASLIPYSGKSKKAEGIVIVLQDITKHKQLDNMRKEFVANVSHEIRTPLTTIKGYAEILLDGAIDDKETAVSFLKDINAAADRMSLLANDLLELSRLDSKKMQFNFEDINIITVVKNCIKQNMINAESKKQHIIFKEPEDKDMYVYIDPLRITQVINNILSNSMKYSMENTKIFIEIKEKDNKYYLYISDNGIGISKENLERIFERFYRVDKARSREMGGNGLGLSIAKEIMEAHGGTITAQSEVGVGTVMTLIFPKTDISGIDEF